MDCLEVLRLKKILTGVIIFITSLLVFFLIYEFGCMPRITVENVELIDAVTLKEHRGYISYYKINENDSKRLMENNTKLKKALITFKYDASFFRTYKDVGGIYATLGNLPPIIVGEELDVAGIGLITIWSRKDRSGITSGSFKMTALIDPQNYNDMEILEMLKTVEVKLWGHYDMGLVIYTPVLVTLPLAK